MVLPYVKVSMLRCWHVYTVTFSVWDPAPTEAGGARIFQTKWTLDSGGGEGEFKVVPVT